MPSCIYPCSALLPALLCSALCALLSALCSPWSLKTDNTAALVLALRGFLPRPLGLSPCSLIRCVKAVVNDG
jgi:hypothetical protein